jgi:hypothetical protein
MLWFVEVKFSKRQNSTGLAGNIVKIPCGVLIDVGQRNDKTRGDYIRETVKYQITCLVDWHEDQSRDRTNAAGSAPDYVQLCLSMFTATYHRHETIRDQMSTKFMISSLSKSCCTPRIQGH